MVASATMSLPRAPSLPSDHEVRWGTPRRKRQAKTRTNSVSLPKITIVTPSFNQGQYLETTFKSILVQDYPNLEWFVVDGGSKDNSLDLIKKYQKHFAWWVSEKDRN